MKRILRYKTLFLSAFILLFSTINAVSEEEKFGDPFARANAGKGVQRVSPPNNGQGGTGEESDPIGDAIPLLCILGFVYGMYVFKRKTVSQQED
ncbi:MAG: hypothetical protein LBO74_17055 [Candidatus Symbiothrix sp.]|jgi:hypothetical protein|nr:hypothetical protein [Candidatus Symbiothrix sp.]